MLNIKPLSSMDKDVTTEVQVHKIDTNIENKVAEVVNNFINYLIRLIIT